LIGIDTNILIRLLARDDEMQFEKSVALVQQAQADGPLFINPLVMTEIVWVLERRFGLPRQQARKQVHDLVDSVEFTVPERIETTMWRDWFSHVHADFFDVVIAATNAESGCSHTFTFDKNAAKAVPGMELLA
jgi:predicted nucleic-acid-binding protein